MEKNPGFLQVLVEFIHMLALLLELLLETLKPIPPGKLIS